MATSRQCREGGMIARQRSSLNSNFDVEAGTNPPSIVMAAPCRRGCPSRLPAFEHRSAFFDKSVACLQMVLGHCGARLMHGLHFEHRSEGLGFGGEKIALHVAVGDPRAVGDASRERRRFALQRLVLDDAANQSE